MKVGLVGCGFIGESIAKAIDKEMSDCIELVAIYDIVHEQAALLSKKLGCHPSVTGSLDTIISDAAIDLVIEAASQNAVRTVVPKAILAGKDVMMLSVGALADRELYQEIKETSKEKGTRVYIPSGAIGGLDWIKAASTVGLDRVMITVRKPPRGLEGAPHVVESEIDLKSIKEPTTIFEGPATQAASAFPANVNVAVALSLAGIGVDKTRVRVIADPTVERNTHEISAEGPAGSITVKVQNLPAPTNPKTSWVAALSAIQKLRQTAELVSLGT